ncbi:MAG: HD domain-containing protein [Lactobacillaceae bacterium]|jgi:putative hydrolase of HD superfamily|nr:HD domain-containing protein [Lactobacillaceae bacterium]
MSMHEYFMGLNNLELIDRAPGVFKFMPHSVASHSWKVTEIAQFLGDVEEEAGNQIDWKSLYEKALNHDYAERFIGDISTPVKYFTPELRTMLANVEDSLTENFVGNEIPEKFQKTYLRRLSEGKDDTLEGKILSVADKLDLLYEAFGELNKNNPEEVYLDMFKSSLGVLRDFKDMPSVQYVLQEIVPDMLNANRDVAPKLWTIYNGVLMSTNN